MASMEVEVEQKSPSLEDCLKLLKGERDEQRLAGLLLVTKFCKGDDYASIRKVYDAVGIRFLDRLLKTGMGKGSVTGNSNRDMYLHLSVTILSALCRVPEIAASEEMVSKISLILEITSEDTRSSFLEECYEFLYLVSSANEAGILKLFESEGLKVLASQVSSFPDGSRLMELAIRLVQLVLSKISLDTINNAYLLEWSTIVTALARQFAVLHNALKFEALNILSAVFSSNHSGPLREVLRLKSDHDWSDYMRSGVIAILQNRVAPAEKFRALILAESAVSIVGERWLLGQVKLPNVQEQVPANRCLLLVLESSRVEIAVLLNDMAYLKFEASKNTSSTMENLLAKQRDVTTAFSLIERIIRLISSIYADEEDLFDEDTFTKVINGLNETIGVVLEYLKDAKDHGQKKGDDLLASVRVVGSYLAETPMACKEKVKELLVYMLSIEGEDEPSSFYSICFLLPMLCQMTMDAEGCKALASCGGVKPVVECLIKLTFPESCKAEDAGCILLACDTILNLLLKLKEQVHLLLDERTYVTLLKALVHWTENVNDPSVLMMASSICALTFDYTSEEALLSSPEIDPNTLQSLSQLIVKSISYEQDMDNEGREDSDLHEIVKAGYSRWASRFPHIRSAVEGRR